MKRTDKYLLFWGGPFSQWYPSTFQIDGVQYDCTEQYMMTQKAEYFDDKVALKEIFATSDPKKQKAIGRKVKNFDPVAWSKIAKSVVQKGNIAKFSQNPDLYEFMVSTGDLEIVEASPYDKIWGIGLGENDPKALDKSQWQGQNLLGEVLMEVRDMLRTKK